MAGQTRLALSPTFAPCPPHLRRRACWWNCLFYRRRSFLASYDSGASGRPPGTLRPRVASAFRSLARRTDRKLGSRGDLALRHGGPARIIPSRRYGRLRDRPRNGIHGSLHQPRRRLQKTSKRPPSIRTLHNGIAKPFFSEHQNVQPRQRRLMRCLRKCGWFRPSLRKRRGELGSCS